MQCGSYWVESQCFTLAIHGVVLVAQIEWNEKFEHTVANYVSTSVTMVTETPLAFDSIDDTSQHMFDNNYPHRPLR